MRAWISLLIALSAGEAEQVTPQAMLAAAVADLETLPPEARPLTRYASFAHLPAPDRPAALAALSFVLNGVSRSAGIARPIVVPGTNDALVRWQIADYAVRDPDLDEFLAAYEALVREDVWFHVATDGKSSAAAPADAPWLDPMLALRLRLLSASAGALLRGDWLVVRLSSPPHYYRFAGIPETREQFEKLLGLDADRIAALRANHGANMFRSQITRKPRRLSRWQGPLGGAWNTYDVARTQADKDPFRDPTFRFRFDAGEHIAAKANGLHLFALFDAAGKRVDEVPADVAKDDSEPFGDGIVRPMISCVRCHVEDGLRPFANDQKTLLAGEVDLYAADPETAEELASFYGDPRLERKLERDREDYREAVFRATGLETAAAAAALATVVRTYQYELVDPARAAAELGLTLNAGETPQAALQRRLAATTDPIVLALCEGLSVQREQWETSFAVAATIGK